MENSLVFLLPLIWAMILVRILFTPMKWVCKLLLHAACGFGCLWTLNLLAPLTGVLLDINAVTVLTAGILGLPGIVLLLLLALW